jgi:hypothetical protein
LQLLKNFQFPKGCYQARLAVRNKSGATESEDIVKKRVTAVLCLLAATAVGLSAESLSYTGTLNTPQDVFATTFTLTATDTVTFQTWGFGGGTNAAGTAIPAGGFDPLITLFSGTGLSATMVVDGSNNPLANADNLYNPPWSFVDNCPAAGTVAIGGNNDCGDVLMQAVLGAGTYTLVLTDANYIPFAVYDPTVPLSGGFSDLTGGAFQTCDPVADACITPNGNYAVDIVSAQSDLTTPIPEPSTLPLLCIGLAVLAGAQLLNKRRMSPHA